MSFPAHLSQLWRAGGHRLRLRRRGRSAAGHQALRAGAQHLQLLSAATWQGSSASGGITARAAGPGSGRAGHDHQRGALGGPARTTSRLPPSHRERIDRQRPSRSRFDGERVDAFEGDTIGSALHAAGRRVISRSFKYHRPRGLLLLRRPLPELPGRGRRLAGRPRLHRARSRGHGGRPHERDALAALRR